VLELQLSQIVVAVDGVLGGRLHLDSQQFVLETFVLLLGQVIVELALARLGAAGQRQPEFGTVSIFIVDVPLAAKRG